MLTADLIKSVAPRAREDYVGALVNGTADLDAYQINTPARLAALLASVCHETGGLTIVRESGNYSAERLVQVWPSHFTASSAKAYAHDEQKLFNYIYGPSTSIGKSLGNLKDGDGFAFRGGGLMQTTGRDNYARIGTSIGIDLQGNPAQIEDASISLKAACWELSKLLAFCDRGAAGWRAVCNGINRGNALSKLDPIGWADRQVWYSRWTAALGGSGTANDTLAFGDQGAMVKAIQERLAALNYPVGRPDGIFGPRLRGAILTFQAENGLTTDGSIGPQTRAALNAEAAKPMPAGERATETVADLQAAGSTQIANAQAIKQGAVVVGALSGGSAAVQQTMTPSTSVDLIAGTKDVVSEVSSWKAITSLMAETAAWATSHLWIAGIVAAFAFWKWGRNIELRRLIEHRLGINLGK